MIRPNNKDCQTLNICSTQPDVIETNNNANV